jgi:hypothetical protein
MRQKNAVFPFPHGIAATCWGTTSQRRRPRLNAAHKLGLPVWPISGHPHAKRIPAHGDCNPRNNDSVIDFHPNLIACFGTSWWNWRDGLTEGCYFDFDFGHGGKALDEEGILLTDQWAAQLQYVQCCTSRSGRGRHWLIRLGTPLPAKKRGEHKRNCSAIMQRVCSDLNFDLRKYVCSFGGIQYLYSNPQFVL